MTALRTWPVRAEIRQRNRIALLEAAAELLADHSYAECSLAAIASRARLTTGAVYSIFGSKAELFVELLKDESRLPALPKPTENAPDVAAALATYARRWARRVAQPDSRRLLELSYELQLAALREPSLMSTLRALHLHEQSVLAEELELAAKVRGEQLPIPAPELAATLTAALQGLTEAAIFLGKPAEPKLFAAVAVRLLG